MAGILNSHTTSNGTAEPLSLVGEAVAKACEEYTKRNPESLKAYNDSCHHLPGGNTRTVLHSSPFPLTFDNGSGAALQDLDYNIYTDFLGEYTAGIYGHNNAAIQAAVKGALDDGVNFGGNNRFEKQLAKTVCERFAPTMELVRFTNSGTEANMCAIATAIAWTGRAKILVFEGAYHGSTIMFPFGGKGTEMNLPHEWVVGTYNDIPKTRSLLQSLPPDSLAAILVEPMLGSGGAVPGSRDFLQFLRHAATARQALLIFDEVMTSRLSYRGRGHALGLRPDLMTLGKWVGGGMSFGAFGGRADVMALFDPRTGPLKHAGTFNNNVVSMAAGVAGCGILDEATVDGVNAVGMLLKGKVEGVLCRCGVADRGVGGASVEGEQNGWRGGEVERCSMWISGIGSILNMHFGGPERELLQELFWHHMLREGIYMAQRGFVALSIEITVVHVQMFVDAVEKFVVGYAALFRRGS
ncbi:hypothetical protein MMC30_003521 [Trapelia coarctata]|nr:hypothetical protein [Trapelia coarctata]